MGWHKLHHRAASRITRPRDTANEVVGWHLRGCWQSVSFEGASGLIKPRMEAFSMVRSEVEKSDGLSGSRNFFS